MGFGGDDRRDPGPGGPHAGGDGAHKLAWELDEEEKELWMQLRRKRDFESRVEEKRAQLKELRERRRKVSSQHAEAAASVDHLKSELDFVQEQQQEIGHDIAVLTESNKALAQDLAQQHSHHRPGAPYGHHSGMDTSAILAEEKQRQEGLQLQHEQIAHLRAHLAKLRAEKADLLRRQQFLFEKQRSAEQDRNRLLGTLQDDRSLINEVRQERIRLWEERSRSEREMAEIVSDAQQQSNSRGNNDRASYIDIGDTTNSARPMDSARQGSSRTGWQGFGAEQGPGGGFPGGPGAAAPASGPFGDARFDSNVSAPGGGGSGVGITEWSDKMREFRGSGGSKAF